MIEKIFAVIGAWFVISYVVGALWSWIRWSRPLPAEDLDLEGIS